LHASQILSNPLKSALFSSQIDLFSLKLLLVTKTGQFERKNLKKREKESGFESI